MRVEVVLSTGNARIKLSEVSQFTCISYTNFSNSSKTAILLGRLDQTKCLGIAKVPRSLPQSKNLPYIRTLYSGL